jgi:hypothetical protein
MNDHGNCAAEVREAWARANAAVGDGPPTEITISTEPPLVANPYIQGLTCPHGVDFWIEPTGDQIAQWVKDGTP